ncbi:uncharacterized protein K452DRAFT_350061 [Aplosporella prunicola CBS 121167]|uniref:Uncharacterized protein n=1 Tax=Aplosporella prunicola CBS 121167 TaxID=1176127 RepID=A0A6A6BJT6_9PEZI|nr:uncharacterized protein K452DRAFT_350061 [Aplosporella prunicola CBS 121167]KAF2143595.1 hypothetical protein K452DRAFT_350061 [Aplosporella prunicola CBS 121167]
MASTAIPSEDLASTLSTLKISTSTEPSAIVGKPKSNTTTVADSWEDDADSDGEGSGAATPTAAASSSSLGAADAAAPKLKASEGPLAPPPTPASPESGIKAAEDVWDSPYYGAVGGGNAGARPTSPPARRPEKTTAVAGRLIAGALGVRAPKRTEEEREFDRAVREKERKRREREREDREREREREESAKRSVWED